MTLEHLLMMASGFDCRDSMDYGWRGIEEMQQTDDWVQYMLDLPMAAPPGTWFEYCNGASFLLSAIIQETTGMKASDFAAKHLFGPLGIYNVAWPANPQGITLGWGDLRMKPHDMAKVGYLYLNEGRWDDKQIIPAEWVAASTHKHIPGTAVDGYGYQWWVRYDGVYMARGFGGQYIFVVPEHELVVAVTSNLSRIRFDAPVTLLDYIIPAAKSSTSLPANPEGVELMETWIQQLSENQDEPEPVPPLPAVADRVTGQTYILEPNPLGLESVSLVFQESAEALLRLTRNLDEIYVDPADSNNWRDVDLPVGLENIYRFSPGPYGIPMGWKGGWKSDEDFVIYVDNIGNTGRNRIQFTFPGEGITIQIKTEGEGEVIRISGRLEE
jgi:hypothetical protein